MKGIADTGFVIAFVCRPDTHHHRAISLERQLTGPLPPREPVLAEAALHIGDAHRVPGSLEDGLLQRAFDCNNHRPRPGELAARDAERKPDFVELSLRNRDRRRRFSGLSSKRAGKHCARVPAQEMKSVRRLPMNTSAEVAGGGARIAALSRHQDSPSRGELEGSAAA